MVAFGVIGSLFGGTLGDILGRRTALNLTLPVFVSAWLCIGLAQSMAVVQVGRCLAGLADGAAVSVIPVYLSEIGHLNLRG